MYESHMEKFLTDAKGKSWWREFMKKVEGSIEDPEAKQAREELARLVKLPKRFTGFLETLAAMPEEIGPMKLVRFLRLARGEWNSVIPVWVTEENGKLTTREILTRNGGRDNGAKGLVFLADRAGKVTDFVMLHAWLFATGGQGFDVVGGARRPGESFYETARRETAEEIGLEPEHVRIYDLGQVWVDACCTCDKPALFVATAPASLCPPEWVNRDRNEYSVPARYPIGRLQEIAEHAMEGRLLEIIGLMSLRGWLRRNWRGRIKVCLP